MKVFAIGDLHLSFLSPVRYDCLEDVKLSKPMDMFGEGWKKHHLKIWDNWQRTVSERDIVLVAGDISWAMKLEEAVFDLEFLESLPGKKILVKGNHDFWWQSLRKISQYLSDRVKLLQNNCINLTDNLVLCGTRGWICPNDSNFSEHDEKIYRRELIRLETSLKSAPQGKEIICMSHYPPVNDKHDKSGFIELMIQYGVKTCVYGHLHDRAIHTRVEGECWGISFYLVSADFLNFKPLFIKDLNMEQDGE